MTGAHLRHRGSDGSRDLDYPPLPEALAVGVYDNHTHLEISDGEPTLEPREQLDRASSVGVLGVVQVGGDLETSRWSAELAEREPRVLAAVALHPNEAPRYAASGGLDRVGSDGRGPDRDGLDRLELDGIGRDGDGPHGIGRDRDGGDVIGLDDALAEIDALASQPRVRAVGETGLDFFRTGEDGRAAQYRSFEAHIEIAKRHGLALQIHDRDAHAEVIATLLRVGAPERTVFHCFSGDAEMARLCADHGWYLSFAGTVTFRNAAGLREALAVTPRGRILVETDAPYLTPHPFRGRPNAPYLIPLTLRAMAEQLGLEVAVLAAEVAATTAEVYGSWDVSPSSDEGPFADQA